MTPKNIYPILSSVDSPTQLRELTRDEIIKLAVEIRRFLIDTTSRTGGHLAPCLGTVELTLALHTVFNTPHDRLVWDIGHQAYTHKILTGRRDAFETLRQLNGLSGFLKRNESEYDTFGGGHSSTSISAALGMAVAANQLGEDRDVVAIIGDGALTGGMAFEALNNAGDLDADLLVVLNDNEMSISRNVGALSNYLARILSGHAYTSVREGSKMVLSTLPPPVKSMVRRWEEHIKGMMMPSTLFEELGFYYIGPIDGHDIDTLLTTLKNMRGMKGPRFLHVVTQKGKGFEPAEGDPCGFHGVSPFNPDTGKLEPNKNGRTYTEVFGDWLCDMAENDERLIGITPAMCEGSGMLEFSDRNPERYFDVGIAEQHALTFAAGLACDGLKPVIAVYSTFLQRAYDQLIHDISIQNLDVTLAIDRAGLVGADGATHAGNYDLSYLRCIPDMVIMAPADEAECRDMLYSGFKYPGPAAIRYPRDHGPGVRECIQMKKIKIGESQLRRQGKDIAILAFGSMVEVAERVADEIDVTVINMRFIKPIDEKRILELASHYALLVTLEENVIMGGAGSAVNEVLNANRCMVRVLNLGVPDRHIEQGSRKQLLSQCGLDEDGIKNSILTAMPKMTVVRMVDSGGR